MYEAVKKTEDDVLCQSHIWYHHNKFMISETKSVMFESDCIFHIDSYSFIQDCIYQAVNTNYNIN